MFKRIKKGIYGAILFVVIPATAVGAYFGIISDGDSKPKQSPRETIEFKGVSEDELISTFNPYTNDVDTKKFAGFYTDEFIKSNLIDPFISEYGIDYYYDFPSDSIYVEVIDKLGNVVWEHKYKYFV